MRQVANRGDVNTIHYYLKDGVIVSEMSVERIGWYYQYYHGVEWKQYGKETAKNDQGKEVCKGVSKDWKCDGSSC